MPESHLESLYQEAQAAVKARDYEYAIELLKRILAVDEDYKDTSRLLVKAVRLRKRRWYNDPRSWRALGAVAVFILGFMNAPKIGGIFARQAPTVTTSPTATNIAKPTSTPTVIPTRTSRPTPTGTPMPAWVTDFAKPILLAIQDRPPDFQDDFSQVSPGWQFKIFPPGRTGEMKIANGVLLMRVGAKLPTISVTHPNMRFYTLCYRLMHTPPQELLNLAGDTIRKIAEINLCYSI